MTEDEYYNWFEKCGYKRTGQGTDTTEDLYNIDRNKFIQVPRAKNLSPRHRKEVAENIGQYLGWNKNKQGLH